MCVAFGDQVTVFLFGERYQASGIVLSILAFGYYANGAVGFNSLLLRVVGRVRYLVTADLGAALVSVVVIVLLIREFGVVGAAVGTTATLLLQNLLYQWGIKTRSTVSAFDERYLRVYASIAIGAVGLIVFDALAHPSFPVAVVAAGLVSLAVLGLNRHDLRILETYPELGRFKIVQRIFGRAAGP
jgi:O-antigen/teichoic acid export membrane protein